MEKILITLLLTPFWFVGLLIIIGVIVLRFVYVLLDGVSYTAGVDVLSDNVRQAEKSLFLFIEQNKDIFYDARCTKIITKLKPEDKDYEEKVLGLVKFRSKTNKDLIKHLDRLTYTTLALSNANTHENKPFGKIFKAQYNMNYKNSVYWVNKTSKILKKLNFKEKAEEVILWGVA